MANLTSPIERFLSAAKLAGCPRDQVENFIRAGQALQPKQLQFAAAARLCDEPGGPESIGFGGAMGGGKSHGVLVQAGCDDSQRFSGLKGLVLRRVGISAREGFNDLRMKVFGNLPHKYTNGQVEFANGSRILVGHFKGENDIDKYLGLEYDWIIVEEATGLTASKMEAIRTRLRSSKPGWRPRMYLTTNPGGVGHAWFKKQFVDPYRLGSESLTRFIPATVDDNQAVGSEYKTVLDRLTGWKLRAWRLGDWDVMAGQFFTNYLEAVHVIEPFELPSGAEFFVALDHGWTHWTTVHLAMKYDGKVFIVDEYGARRTLVVDHVPAILAMLKRNNLGLPKIRRCVAGHDIFAKRGDSGTTIADSYKAEGIVWKPAIVDRINGAGEIVRLLGEPMTEDTHKEPKLFIFNRCAGLIRQIADMVHDPNRPDDVLKVDCDEDGDGGDDFYDSARMAIMETAAKKKAGWSTLNVA